ncbi:MAG: DUF4380 domain-containing protein [Bdellovibrionota bacterium]
MEISKHTLDAWTLHTLNTGKVQLSFLPAIGGRLQSIRYQSRELLFSHPLLEGNVEYTSALAEKCNDAFALWGGDKTWIAPQNQWNMGKPYQDLDSKPYTFKINTSDAHTNIVLTSPLCSETGLIVTRTFTLHENSSQWQVTHSLTNQGQQHIKKSLWDVTMLCQPAHVFIPIQKESIHPDGLRTFTHEGSSTQLRSRVCQWHKNMVTVDCQKPSTFKFGSDDPGSWIVAKLENQIMLGKKFLCNEGTIYPDHCSIEVYNSEKYPYCELELLTPMVDLAPGASHQVHEICFVTTCDKKTTTRDDLEKFFQENK